MGQHKKRNPNLPRDLMNKLQAGDVLLSSGTDEVSELIKILTGGRYSHSAIFDGEMVIEAIDRGVGRYPLKDHIEDQKGGVDAYRFKSSDGQQLGEPGWRADPVIEIARHYCDIGTKFSYEQLFLLIPLVSLKRIPGIPRRLRVLVLKCLDVVLERINKLSEAGKQPMICSELVYRCFSEAVPMGKYTLTLKEIGKFTAASGSTGTKDPELQKLILKADEVSKAYFAAKKHKLPAAGEKFSSEVIPDFVTPRDLRESPNLELLCYLSLPLV
jgi:hypothetical protein